MTSPLHGEGRAFESPRAHLFFNDLEEKNACAAFLAFSPKLPTPREKLPTRSQWRADDFRTWNVTTPSTGHLPTTARQTVAGETLSDLALPFSANELSSYVDYRVTGLADLSRDWITRAARTFWDMTTGVISKITMDNLRQQTLTRNTSSWSHGKTLSFAKAFLKYLAKMRLDTRYLAFAMFLEMPKTVKIRKAVTSRIVTRVDIENVLLHVWRAQHKGEITKKRALQYTAFVIFGAYGGQRSNATMMKLTVRQFREALRREKPCVKIGSEQDKVRLEHYVPLHPRVIRVIRPLLDDQSDDDRMFEYESLVMWVKRQQIPMSQFKGHFVLGDLRKFCEQYGDIIQWDQSNRAYVMTHGVSNIEWKHYRHPLPDSVYDVDMKYWADVRFQFHS